MRSQQVQRRGPLGADVVADGVHFRVWAPTQSEVKVVVNFGPREEAFVLDKEAGCYFSGQVSNARAGMTYRYLLGDSLYPDPASRFQPDGPHGPSEIIDPTSFSWSDAAWKGVGRDRQVIYEMHVGTFTPEGSWPAATRELKELADLGVTLIEVMPVADFPGRFGWGYDGVNLFAPTRLYGRPDDFRRFVDGAHAVGVGVILDVVYNHIGPDGNYLKAFSPHYFTDRYKNEWGEPLNFDGEHSAPVREFFIANAGYWIDEYHLDGLRLDATQQIFDASPTHVVAAVARQVRQSARGRGTFVVAENEPQDARLAVPVEQGGQGLDAVWNDDFHHSAHVAVTGRSEAYYSDFHGTPQELLSAVKWGFLHQGQRSTWQKKRRGSSAFHLPPTAFVTFLQNHDQVANSAHGLRLHQLTSPGRYRAMTALLLLAPQTPMLFQGQEFAASGPFLFFADHNSDLAKLVREGRANFLAQFPSIGHSDARKGLPDPSDPATFERCKLDLNEREKHAEVYALTRDLLRLRREDPTLRAPRRGDYDGAVLGPEALVLRFFGAREDDRLLVVNLGRDLGLVQLPEPLLAPPADQTWETIWSSEETRYAGHGTAPLEDQDCWKVPGHCAVLLKPVPSV